MIAPAILGCVMTLPVVLSGCGMMAPRSNAGFAELDSPGFFDTDNRMSLSIGPTLLHFAAAHIDDDPETQALLSELEGVRIRIYEIKRNAAKVTARMAEMRSKLQQSGWEPVMLVREEGEQAHLLMKMREDHILGLTLLALGEDSEIVMINLIGEVRPQRFSNVMVALDIGNNSARHVQVSGL